LGKKPVAIVLLFLLPGLFLTACGSGQVFTPTLTSLPSAAPTATNTPVPEPTSTDVDGIISMNCEDEALIDTGDYRVQNNTWGNGNLSGWSQCIGLGMKADGTVVARWTWDWLSSGTNVKAYPEIIFGQKPGSTTTSEALPIQISEVGAATISYDVSSTYTGSGNVAFDLWLTDTPNPSTWGVPPITHEIMIWLDSRGGMHPGGTHLEQVSFDGFAYNVSVGENFGQGWRYIAFASVESQLGAGTLDLGSILSYIREKNLVKGDEYLASIEFGNEIIGGAGETVVNRYTVSVQKK
jgi:hypothetical protein